ncbi:MAG: hypothetical protein ACE5JF_00935 [Anaerolineales bacterium]
MALLPSITLILGALALVLLRGRRPQSVSLIGAGIALVATIAGLQQSRSVLTITLWRPVELFGPGFLFAIDKTVWPFLLMGSAAVLAEVLLEGRSTSRLLYASIALAAIAAGNLVTIVMLWTLMIAVESGLRLSTSDEIETTLWKSGVQFAAVAAALASTQKGFSAPVFLMIAVGVRSIGGADARFPFTLAVLAPLGALAAASREPAQLPWIAGAAVVSILVYSLLFRSRLTLLALALVGAGFLALPDAQSIVFASGAAALLAIVALEFAGLSRISWVAVAVVPFALVTTSLDLMWGVVLATALAAIARLRFADERGQSLTRLEMGAAAILLTAAILATLSAGWLLSLGGATAAMAGLSVGYALSRGHRMLSNLRLPSLVRARSYVIELARFLAAAIRTTAEVFEGESAVLWILLVLLIAIIGIQAVTA